MRIKVNKRKDDNFMNPEHKVVINKVLDLAVKKQDICDAIERMCVGWSDDTSKNLIDTYYYVQKNQPNELVTFIGGLKCMVHFGEHLLNT